ncbi:VOC family protein [Alicyclobacillus fodiniaquatilis]|uniref:VOC family protein n=1 Tax=Alicyclobacillus fodiniaquatilis TaxID=1661150 RepID=A0ABW4JCV4_9BACL
MELQFDHLLHAVHDPLIVRRDFERQFAYNTVAGGVHPQWGTYNALAYFGLSYIEWIGIKDEQTARGTEFGRQVASRLDVGEGAIQFALRTTKMDEVAALWRGKGLEFTGPLAASRQRPDGQVLQWRMLFPRQEAGGAFKLPFLIEWQLSDEARLADLQQTGALTTAPGYQMRAVHSAVQDLSAFANRWRMYFGDGLELLIDDTRGDEGLCIQLGDVQLCFWVAANRQVSADVDRVGEHPYQLDFVRMAKGQSSHPCAFHGLMVRV